MDDIRLPNPSFASHNTCHRYEQYNEQHQLRQQLLLCDPLAGPAATYSSTSYDSIHTDGRNICRPGLKNNDGVLLFANNLSFWMPSFGIHPFRACIQFFTCTVEFKVGIICSNTKARKTTTVVENLKRRRRRCTPLRQQRI